MSPTSPRSVPRPRVLSGMRPTGRLHLGNYMGALHNWVHLQQDYDCYFFIADFHALTTDYADPGDVQANNIEIALDFLAAGLDPGRCVIFQQSDVPHTPSSSCSSACSLRSAGSNACPPTRTSRSSSAKRTSPPTASSATRSSSPRTSSSTSPTSFPSAPTRSRTSSSPARSPAASTPSTPATSSPRPKQPPGRCPPSSKRPASSPASPKTPRAQTSPTPAL